MTQRSFRSTHASSPEIHHSLPKNRSLHGLTLKHTNYGGKLGHSNHFWAKCKKLPKCTEFCSACKLEVAAKNFSLLTKTCLMHWQVQGLKGSISGNFCVHA